MEIWKCMEEYEEYAYYYQGVEGEGLKETKITDIISSTNNFPTEIDEDSLWPIYKNLK